MHPEDIKAEIRKRGAKCSDVARDLRISGNAVSLVVHGHSTSRRVARHIGQIIRKHPNEIWPGRYPDPDNKGRKAA